MKEYILIIEDEHSFSQDLSYLIEERFRPGLGIICVETIQTFMDLYDHILEYPPFFILLDLMIFPGDIDDNMKNELSLGLDGGIFCLQRISKDIVLRQVPVAIISARAKDTVWDKIRIHNQVIGYIEKPIVNFEKIFEMIHSSTSLIGKPMERKTEKTFNKLISAIEAKPGAFGLNIDFKKLLKANKANSADKKPRG